MNNQPKVYAVIGGYDYEGERFDSLKLFDCKSTAEEYYEYLKEHERYDYVKIELMSIDMTSMFESIYNAA